MTFLSGPVGDAPAGRPAASKEPAAPPQTDGPTACGPAQADTARANGPGGAPGGTPGPAPDLTEGPIDPRASAAAAAAAPPAVTARVRQVPLGPAQADFTPRDGWTRFVVISDTHFRHRQMPEPLPPGDVLVHCGDFCQARWPDHLGKVADFGAWLAEQPHMEQIILAGNHDLTFDAPFYARDWPSVHETRMDDVAVRAALFETAGPRLRQLINEGAAVRGGLRVWASPHTPVNRIFGAYQLRREDLPAVWAKMPVDLDVVLTHGPPAGLCDGTAKGTRDGCASLREAVLGRPEGARPALHLFGHIHEGYGVATEGGIVFANAATCNRVQEPSNPPFVFDVAWPPAGGGKDGGVAGVSAG